MTGSRLRKLGIALALGALGCASSPVGSVRFHNRDPVWRVADRRPIPQPEERGVGTLEAHVHDIGRRPLLHALSVPEPVRAQNVNSLGEVPDSTWFENRIGRRDLSVADVRRGPNRAPAPVCAEPPLRVLRRKELGAAIGFRVEDARGERYIVKLGTPQHPETETGGDVVVQRLLWAVGYHVPENCVLLVQPEEISVAPDAYELAERDRKQPLTRARLDELLARAPMAVDGVHQRFLASKVLEGVPVGGFPMEGVREDDPNDRVPHQHRRDVRGQKVVFGWLAHTDIKENNTLDTWIEDPPGSGRGYVVHHLIDFGRALGEKAFRDPADGWAHLFDYEYAALSALTFGIWKRPWEDGTEDPGLRGIGRYDAEHFDPSHYRPSRPYEPFLHTDRFDAYWAAKILIRLTPEHIEAAVSQGMFSDPRSEAYLQRTIVARQRATARHWFSEVNPVDAFRLDPDGGAYRLCATDLLLRHHLADAAGTTRYELAAWDYEGRALGWRRRLEASADGRLCAAGLRPARIREGYTIVTVRTVRDGEALPPMAVHLARRDGDGAFRVIGIRRY